MLGALVFSHLLIPVALTLLDCQSLCLWHVSSLSLDRRRKQGREKKGNLRTSTRGWDQSGIKNNNEDRINQVSGNWSTQRKTTTGKATIAYPYSTTQSVYRGCVHSVTKEMLIMGKTGKLTFPAVVYTLCQSYINCFFHPNRQCLRKELSRINQINY